MCTFVIYVWEGIISGETTSESNSVVSFVSFLISCESSFHSRGWACEVCKFFIRLLSIPPVSQQLRWTAAMKGHGRKTDLLDIKDQTLGGIWAAGQRPWTRRCHQYKANTKGRALKVTLAIKQTGWQTFLVGHICIRTPPLIQSLASAFSQCVFSSRDIMSSNNTVLSSSSSLILLASKFWSSRYT